jgi:hypothetical protein
MKCRNMSHCDWPVTPGDIVALLLLNTSDTILVLTDDLHLLYLFELNFPASNKHIIKVVLFLLGIKS